MKKVLFFIALMSLFIPNTYALKEGCNSDEYNNLITKAREVEMSFKFDQYNGYTVTLSNLDSNIYGIDEFGLRYESDSNNQVSINPYLDHGYYLSNYSMYDITFYAKGSTSCGDELLDVKEVIVPAYNPYSKTEVCSQNPDDEFCAELITFSISQKQFDKKFNQSTQEDNNKDDKEEKDDKEDNGTILDNSSNSQLLFFLVLIIVVVTVMILVIRWHNKKVDTKRAKRYSDIRRGKYNSGKIEDLIDKDNK